MSKIYVIAGTRAQALQWMQDNCEKRYKNGNKSASLSDYVIISDPDRLRGVSDPHGVFVGTWKQNARIADIIQTLIVQSNSHNQKLIDLYEQVRPTVVQHHLGFKPSMVMIKGKNDKWVIFDEVN